jgi:hypothetical protein
MGQGTVAESRVETVLEATTLPINLLVEHEIGIHLIVYWWLGMEQEAVPRV